MGAPEQEQSGAENTSEKEWNLWIDVPEEKEEEREVCKKTSVGVYR